MGHIPVLKDEAIHALALRPDSIVVDGTAGGGGHARDICAHLGQDGTYIGIDLDGDAVKRVSAALGGVSCTVCVKQANYRDVESVLQSCDVSHMDAFLLDLGMSSFQLEESGRGFSFQKDEPLLMTFAAEKDLTDESLTARHILNEWEEEAIANVLFGYGEERFARKIARAVVQTRATKPFETTYDLVESIERAVPTWYRTRRAHCATKSFQALRIAVNDELRSLEEGLRNALTVLAEDGRIAIIAFHSIEDRIVKQFFITQEKEGNGKRITKKPIKPSQKEITHNPRARSATLRVFTKHTM